VKSPEFETFRYAVETEKEKEGRRHKTAEF
jgi:hypothetical protein